MSTAVTTGTPKTPGEVSGMPFIVPANPARALPPVARPSYVRRRGTLAQGQALETLGHAVEYLIDSGMFHQDAIDTRANQEAVQILMRLSRLVFAECPEVIPVRRRFARWMLQLASRVRRKPLSPAC